MSKNEVTLFNQSGGLVVPDYINEALGGRTNITGRKTTPSLMFDGKVWQYNVNGEKHQIQGKNAEGDVVPLQIMRVCIIGYNDHRGRTYYEGVYDPAKPGSPQCWSENGETPDAAVPSPCAVSCKACPNAVKGSKVSAQGKPVAACSQHRLMAVIPISKMGLGPLRLKISGTSDYDKNEEMAKKEWFAFSNYKDYIHARGVKHSSAIVTKIMFDPNVPYPKLMFQAERFLTGAEMTEVAEYLDSDIVQTLLNNRQQDQAITSRRLPVIENKPAPAPAQRAVMPPVQSKAIDAVAQITEDDDEDEPAPAPKKTAAKVKQTKKVDTVEPEAMPVVKSPSASPKPAPEVDPSLEAILDDWGE